VSERRPFPRAARLRRSGEIRAVFRSGERRSCGPCDAFLLDAGAERPRAAIVVPRHGRTAVERNRLKRRLREIIRRCWLPVAPPADLVIRARPAAYAREFGELRDGIVRGLGLPGC
jgi:ribonuclease P protein component